MLARVLGVGCLVEVLVYSLLAVTGPGRPSWPLLFLALLAGALLVRLMIIAWMFGMAWRHRMRRPPLFRIGPVRAMGLVLREYGALLLCYSLLHPLGRWLTPRQPATPAGTAIPVLLLHGFFCNEGYWTPLLRFLRREGVRNVFTLNLEPLFGPIDRYVPLIHARVEEMAAATGARQVVLIGHSMGGLASRAYAYSPEGRARVRGVMTLGTPHHGTALSLPWAGGNLAQMRLNSPWLQALEAQREILGAPPIVSLYSSHDNIVAPQDSSHLEGAQNSCLPGLGHLAMVCDHQVQHLVLCQLRAWQTLV